jgi:hypothetical protein
VSAQKKKNVLRPIPNPTKSPSSPAVRQPISVVIPFHQLRKKVAMMRNANVSLDEIIVFIMAKELPSIQYQEALAHEDFTSKEVSCR